MSDLLGLSSPKTPSLSAVSLLRATGARGKCRVVQSGTEICRWLNVYFSGFLARIDHDLYIVRDLRNLFLARMLLSHSESRCLGLEGWSPDALYRQ